MFGAFSNRGGLSERTGDVVRLNFVEVILEGEPSWIDGVRAPACAESIARAFLRSGLQCLATLDGGFALAIVDLRTETLHLAIDRMGISTLAWHQSGDSVTFGSSPRAVAERAGGRPVLRAQALYDYFFFHMVPAPTSAFVGVQKLRAASVLSFSAAGREEAIYWRPDFNRRTDARFESLRSDLNDSLRNAVDWASRDPKSGAFLSGGLDSSTVSGMFAALRPGAKTFSIGFGEEGYDERFYARIASRHFECEAHEYVVTPQDVLAAIPIVAGAYDEPFGNSSAIPTYFCARFARQHGMETLLAGDGGDEIFGGNERYARQRLFEMFQRMPAPLRRTAIALTRGISPESWVMPLRKLRSYVDQASITLPERFETWNFVHREGGSLLFDDAFMRMIDPRAPLCAIEETYTAIESPDLLDRMLVYDWKYTLADNDLRKVSTMCHAAGVEVRYPMLDAAVVDLSLRIPTAMKMNGFELRSFYKRAMKGFLPDEILEKKKHGFGLPFGVWLKTHARLAEFVYENLKRFNERGVVRPEFIDRLIAEHQEGHPGYYGYIIWDLVMLEQWLERLPDATFSAS